jgi:hypothetical protein
MKTEFKKWLSVLLLDWSFSIMPDCKFKIELAKFIDENLMNGMD